MRTRITVLLTVCTVAFACQGGEKKSPEPPKTEATEPPKDTQAAAPASKPAMPPPPKTIPAPPDVAEPPADAEKTKSGLASKVLTKGEGKAHPSASDTVEVHYTGWTTDGKMFDSSVQRGKPTRFRLNGVIAGWTEGVQLMTKGEKRRFWIPEELAYKGRPGAPQGMLVFDVELLEIIKAPDAPADVAAPPKDATKTASGLYSKVLSPGQGGENPKAYDTVEVHYTGWTTDGKMFDSSVQRGKPTRFRLNG
ncbi:MAG: FKBP-type peptidyl-prolyl cis-trans isomerase, partial [Myxococcota bacterium]